MPDLLVLHADRVRAEQIEALAHGKSVRAKLTTDLDIALEWMRLKSVDLVFLDAAFPFEEQSRVGERLWKTNPSAPLVVYCFAARSYRDLFSVKLFGAELAYGPRTMAALEEALDRLLVRPPPQREKTSEVLVVEDLDSPRDIICMLIESKGLRVRGSASAEEALRILEKEPEEFSCIVSDVKMPGIGGKGLIEKVRGEKALWHLPIVVLTAYGSVDTLVDCLKAGASGFLLKPPRTKDLEREILRALRIRATGGNPRLVSRDEADSMKELLLAKGFI